MCGRGCCIHHPERSVTLWPLTAGATHPSAKSNGLQRGREATQRGSRCLSRSIPSLMSNLFVPVSLRLPSWRETQIINKRAGFVSAGVCAWEGGLLEEGGGNPEVTKQCHTNKSSFECEKRRAELRDRLPTSHLKGKYTEITQRSCVTDAHVFRCFVN